MCVCGVCVCLARMLHNEEGYQLERDRLLHGGGGGGQNDIFSVTYLLNDPRGQMSETICFAHILFCL